MDGISQVCFMLMLLILVLSVNAVGRSIDRIYELLREDKHGDNY
jgi:hypothetical protein